MKMNKSLKDLFGLKYEDSNIQTGLIRWYNRVIDKSIEDLNVVDVAKMIRQDVLRDIAIDKAIKLFLIDPFDGEMEDGDLLALLVSCGPMVAKNEKAKKLRSRLLDLENEYEQFDWVDENSKALFGENIAALKGILNKD